MGVTSVTIVLRILLVVTATLSFVYKEWFDSLTEAMWNTMRNNYYLSHDSLEPVVAVFSFFFWIRCWTHFHWIVPNSVLARSRISARPDHFEDLHGKDIWTKRDQEQPFWVHLNVFVYLAPIMLYDSYYPRRDMSIPAPSFHQFIYQIAAAIFLYDLIFTLGHLILHKNKKLFNKIHAIHHKTQLPDAYDTINVTFAEQFILVSTSILALNIVNAHPLSRVIYNIVITYLLTELHCGYDFPWMLANIIPFGLVQGSVQHEAHHKYGTCYYQKFFSYIDKLIGSDHQMHPQWKDFDHPKYNHYNNNNNNNNNHVINGEQSG